MAKKLFTEKSMQARNFRKSAAMEKIMDNKRIANVLGSDKERRQFYDELKKYGSGGVTKREMAEVLGKLRNDKGDSISREEARVIGKEMLGSGVGAYKRYIRPDESGHHVSSLGNNMSDGSNSNSRVNLSSSRHSYSVAPEEDESRAESDGAKKKSVWDILNKQKNQ